MAKIASGKPVALVGVHTQVAHQQKGQSDANTNRAFISHFGWLLGGFGCEGNLSDEINHASIEKAESALTSETSWPHDFRKLYAAPATEGSLSQVRDLWQSRNYQDALKILALVTTPHAAWFATGTAEEVRKSVRNTMALAERQRSLPAIGT